MPTVLDRPELSSSGKKWIFILKKNTCNAICETIDNGSESLSLSFIVTPVSMWFGISDLIRLNSFPQHKYDRYALN